MSMANQFLSLSLFIMLLSFFIILNALSNFEEVKSRPVLNSLATTFSNKNPEDILAPNVIEAQQQALKEGDTLDKLQALFTAHISGVKVTKNRLGTTMHVRMPLNQFERSLTAPISTAPSQRLGAPGTFIPTLLSLMQTRETEVPYRMDMVLNTDENPAKMVADSPDQTRIKMQKVSSLANRLENSGLEKKLLSAGLGSGEDGMIDIYFARYVPVNPLEGTEEGNDGG